MELVAVFSRRNPDSVNVINTNVTVLHIDEAKNYTEAIDVMILCGGSATDLPEQVPAFAEMFNTVDSYDTHAKIPEYFASVDNVAQASGKTSIISFGWDPGMFSMTCMMYESLFTECVIYTFTWIYTIYDD